MKLRTSRLKVSASLTTKTGKKVYLSHYEPPGQDGLGAKFFFPKKLPDGTPLATATDKEIRFVAPIGNRIFLNFKIEDMIFQGRLEI
jgi:hypothetical protein